MVSRGTAELKLPPVDAVVKEEPLEDQTPTKQSPITTAKIDFAKKCGRKRIKCPAAIKANEYRVVQSDTRYHYFNGSDGSFCNMWKCGPIENLRPNARVHNNVPLEVTKRNFCAICIKKSMI